MLIKRVIFVESTISLSEIQIFLDGSDLVLSSIRRGQLIELYKIHPNIQEVIIVDGVFEQCPSITHKEILWLLSQKIKVVGIASMGALRAYELRNHGMQGYGWVYEQFLNGNIDGDDEVAISHNPLSPSNMKTIAMVNLRKTLMNTPQTNFLKIAKSIHFRMRTWKELSKHFSPLYLKKIIDNYIDIKKEDVIAYISKPKINLIKIEPMDFIPNIYFNRMKIYYSELSLTDYIRKCIVNTCLIDDSYTNNVYDDCIYVCNFLLLSSSYAPKVALLLSDIDDIICDSKKIKNYVRIIQNEFKIKSHMELQFLLEKRNIPINRADKLIHNLAKLFEIFCN